MLNIRGADIPYNPLVYSVLVVTPSEAHLFIDQKKLKDDVRLHLKEIRIHDYEAADSWIREWEKNESSNISHRVR